MDRNKQTVVLHCCKCEKPFEIQKDVLFREAIDEFDEAWQAGYCSTKCLYEEFEEDEEQKFLSQFIDKKYDAYNGIREE